jgi:hypothetical protein
MSDVTHVTDRHLARAIDGEMTAEEHAEFEAHLVRCDACLERWEALAEFWNEIERAIDTTPVKAPRGAREQLVEALAGERTNTPARAARRIPGWYWAAAIAATAAILFFASREPKQAAPKQDVARHQIEANPAPVATRLPDSPALPAQDSGQPARRKAARNEGSRQQTAGNAETSAFIRLPYVDAAQPMQTAGLVRVQMRLSMLANAGVIRMMPGASDGPVQADVLLGLDGQPYAIRLVSASQ